MIFALSLTFLPFFERTRFHRLSPLCRSSFKPPTVHPLPTHARVSLGEENCRNRPEPPQVTSSDALPSVVPLFLFLPLFLVPSSSVFVYAILSHFLMQTASTSTSLSLLLSAVASSY